MKQSTLQTKHNIFASHIAPYFEGIPVEEITAADIAAWQKNVKETKKSNGQPLSPAYLRTVQSQLNALINYASGKGYISINPLVDIKMCIRDRSKTAMETIVDYNQQDDTAHVFTYDPDVYKRQVLTRATPATRLSPTTYCFK